jgi:hypothetical protein
MGQSKLINQKAKLELEPIRKTKVQSKHKTKKEADKYENTIPDQYFLLLTKNAQKFPPPHHFNPTSCHPDGCLFCLQAFVFLH